MSVLLGAPGLLLLSLPLSLGSETRSNRLLPGLVAVSKGLRLAPLPILLPIDAD